MAEYKGFLNQVTQAIAEFHVHNPNVDKEEQTAKAGTSKPQGLYFSSTSAARGLNIRKVETSPRMNCIITATKAKTPDPKASASILPKTVLLSPQVRRKASNNHANTHVLLAGVLQLGRRESSSKQSLSRASGFLMHRNDNAPPKNRHTLNDNRRPPDRVFAVKRKPSKSSSHRDLNNDTSEVEVGGFANFGNTCYLGSLLQALLSFPNIGILFSRFEGLDADSACAALLELYNGNTGGNLTSSKRNATSARTIQKAVVKENPALNSMTQEDLNTFLAGMFKTLRTETGSNEFAQQFLLGMQTTRFCPNRLCDSHNSGDNTVVTSLSLDSSTSVANSIKEVFEEERIERRCSGCSNEVAHQKSQLIKAPEILIISLNRLERNRVAVSFDRELKLQGCTYELKSSVHHTGVDGSGHYIAHRITENNEWKLCNDSAFSTISDVDVFGIESQRDVFLLFYQLNRT